jgi:hypothetical protein
MLAFSKEKAEDDTHVFKEREKCQRPNNGADTTDYILLRRNRAICGPYSVKDIQR